MWRKPTSLSHKITKRRIPGENINNFVRIWCFKIQIGELSVMGEALMTSLHSKQRQRFSLLQHIKNRCALFPILVGERQALVWFVVQKTRSVSTQRGKMKYRRLARWRCLRQPRPEENWGIPLWEAQDPCLHAALWRGSILPPFMPPDNQQQPCCLDQWFANFHTRHKQRLNMGEVPQFVESVLFHPST